MDKHTEHNLKLICLKWVELNNSCQEEEILHILGKIPDVTSSVNVLI